jgi:hypothetical protein
VYVEAVAFDDQRGLIRGLLGMFLEEIVLAVASKSCDRPAAHRYGCASVQGRLHRGLTRAGFERRVFEVAAAPEPNDRPTSRALDDGRQVRSFRRRRVTEGDPSLRVPREHAIEHDDVKVDVEVQAAKALHERDRAAPRLDYSKALARAR